MELLANRAAALAAKGVKVKPVKPAKASRAAKGSVKKISEGGSADAKVVSAKARKSAAAKVTVTREIIIDSKATKLAAEGVAVKPVKGTIATFKTGKSVEIKKVKVTPAVKKASKSAAVSSDAAGSGSSTNKSAGLGIKVSKGPNAYMLWKQQRWQGLKEENPGLGFKDLMRLTSEEWSGLDQEAKKSFEAARLDQT